MQNSAFVSPDPGVRFSRSGDSPLGIEPLAPALSIPVGPGPGLAWRISYLLFAKFYGYFILLEQVTIFAKFPCKLILHSRIYREPGNLTVLDSRDPRVFGDCNLWFNGHPGSREFSGFSDGHSGSGI